MFHVMRNAHRPASRTQNHHIRNRNRAFPLGNAALNLLARVGPRMPLDHRDMLDQHFAGAFIDAQHAPALAPVAPRDYPHLVVLFDLNAHRLGRLSFRNSHQITSGASDTIFMNFLSRNSRATGPKTRVPTGSPTSLISTAALESKRM